MSSAYDLIDYTRRHCRKVYGQVEFGKEIQSEIDRRFIYEPDFKLAQGLRSISAHVGTLQVSLNLAPGKERAKDAPFKVQAKELLGWDEWNDNQRSLLESMQEDVDIHELAGRYFRKMEEFYSWLWKRESEVPLERSSRRPRGSGCAPRRPTTNCSRPPPEATASRLGLGSGRRDCGQPRAALAYREGLGSGDGGEPCAAAIVVELALERRHRP